MMTYDFAATRRKFLTKALLSSIIIVSGCDQKKSEDSGKNRRECYKVVEGEQLFVGDPACISKLPIRSLQGVLVYGFENVVFYEGATQPSAIRPEDGVWLYLNAEVRQRIGRDTSFNETLYFLISFDGSITREAGFYGHMGQFKGGATITKLRELKKL